MADQTEILTWGCSVGRNPPTSGILEQLTLRLAAQSARDESARAFERCDFNALCPEIPKLTHIKKNYIT